MATTKRGTTTITMDHGQADELRRILDHELAEMTMERRGAVAEGDKDFSVVVGQAIDHVKAIRRQLGVK